MKTALRLLVDKPSNVHSDIAECWKQVDESSNDGLHTCLALVASVGKAAVTSKFADHIDTRPCIATGDTETFIKVYNMDS